MYVNSCPHRLHATVSLGPFKFSVSIWIRCKMAEPSSVVSWASCSNRWLVNVAGIQWQIRLIRCTGCSQVQPSISIGALWFVSIWVAGGGVPRMLSWKCCGHPVAELCSVPIPATSVTITMSADNTVTLTDSASALCTLSSRDEKGTLRYIAALIAQKFATVETRDLHLAERFYT